MHNIANEIGKSSESVDCNVRIVETDRVCIPPFLMPKSPMPKEPSLKYCVYCGDWYECRDHVIPVSWTHTFRNYKPGSTVPCCNLCNQLAGDYVPLSFEDKASFLIARYQRKFAKILRLPHWTDEEIEELDYGLRALVLLNQGRKAILKAKIINLVNVENGGNPYPLRFVQTHQELIRSLIEG